MPAPRNCRVCGTKVPPSVRWCTLCYAPVVELSARPYVGGPVVEGHRVVRDHAGHWSRWEKSATTMGPRGRILATILIAVWLSVGFFFEFLPIWLCQFGLLIWVLTGIWRKGWAIPNAPASPRQRLTDAERRSLVPHLSDWREAPGGTKALFVGGALSATVFWLAWSTGDHTRQGIMAIALTISLGVVVLYRLVRPS